MSKITGYLVDAKNRKAGAYEVDRDLQKYYELLNCDIVDVATRKIGDKYYDIICDDEGLLKSDAIISGVCADGSDGLVGNLFIVNLPDDEGNWQSLTDDDVKNINRNGLRLYLSNGVAHPAIQYNY